MDRGGGEVRREGTDGDEEDCMVLNGRAAAPTQWTARCRHRWLDGADHRRPKEDGGAIVGAAAGEYREGRRPWETDNHPVVAVAWTGRPDPAAGRRREGDRGC